MTLRPIDNETADGNPPPAWPVRVSEELEHWLRSDGDKTLGGLIEVFEQKSFALLFVLLLGVPALTLPTGGVTHVFEVIAIVLALQMVAGRKTIWLPRRWCRLELGGPTRERFLTGLLRMIRRLEHVSRPRFAFVFGHRTSNAVVGLLVTGFSAAAFVAPPFSASTRCPPSARSCSRWVSSSRTRRWRPRASSSLSSASRWSWPSAGRSRGASGRCSDAPLARPSSRPRRPEAPGCHRVVDTTTATPGGCSPACPRSDGPSRPGG